MINLFAYMLSFAIGFLCIRLILGKETTISLLLHISLSIGLGLAISGIITFFFLLLYGQFSQIGLIMIHLLVLLLLFTLNFFYLPQNTYPRPEQNLKYEKAFKITTLIAWIIVITLIGILSQQFPSGGWDAWGLYNMKAKFLIYGGRGWTNVTRLHWHTQPSYPLLLPLINAWIFSVFQKSLTGVAATTGALFSISCGFLFYAGLSMFIKRPLALMAALVLATTPSYIFWSTTQYADVLLAYYLLASAILLILSMRTQKPRMALLAGLFWGIMPLAKNEGIVLLILLIISTCALLLTDKTYNQIQSKKLIKNLILGASLTVFMNLIFKIFLAPATREVLYNPFAYKLKYCNLQGFLITVHFYFTTMISLGWALTWGIIALIGMINYKKWFLLKESRILTLVLAGFTLSVLYVYLMTAHFDLTWRLECTASRILFYLLPTLLFLSFYTLWTRNPNNQS